MPTAPDQHFWSPLRVTLVVLLVPAACLAATRLWVPTDARDPAAARSGLDALAQELVDAGDLARPDGKVYAVDIGQLALYAARAKKRALYGPLRGLILERFYVDRGPGDDATGMVAWCREPAGDTPPDASGTTETLRCAQALWEGARAFGHDDEAVVRAMLAAYARHQAEERGTWFVRNYFNLQSYTYATNSFLIDHDPDFVAAAAEAFGDDTLRGVAERSAGLMTHALTPAGLLHQMIRPEVGTIQPTPGGRGLYSVNGVEQLSNVLASAERCVATNRRVAEAVMAFVRPRLHDLHLYYDARDGRRTGGRRGARAGAETWPAVVRLAAGLDEPAAFDAAFKQLVRHAAAGRLADDPARLYLVGEALLAFDAADRYRPTPAPTPDDPS